MTADLGKQLYALAHGVPVDHVEEADVGLSAVRAALAAAPVEQGTDEVRSWSLPAPPPDGVAVVHIPEMYELQGGPELHRSDEDRELWWGPDGSLWSWSQMLGEGTVVAGAAPCKRCGHAADQHVGEDIGCLDEQCPCAVYQPPALKPQAAESPGIAHTETVTQYRVVGRNVGRARTERYGYPTAQAAIQAAADLRAGGYGEAAAESRTVTTSRRESEWKATDQ